MPRIGVLLSGCGVFDGAGIHEAVLILPALDRAGAEIEISNYQSFFYIAPGTPRRLRFILG